MSYCPEQHVGTEQTGPITRKYLFIALCASQRLWRQEAISPEHLHGDGNGPVAW